VSNYTQSTNFATKDALSPGDPLKIVRGTEINTEFTNIAVAVATKLDTTGLASPGPIGATTPSSFNGTTGTFSGAVSGTTGTFSGAVSGTTGTFSGNVQMASANGGQLAGLRNKIINGDMAIWQRGTAAYTSVANAQYTADRFFLRSSYTGGTTTITQSTGPNQNVRFSLRVTHATATATVVTGQNYAIRQAIEKSVARGFTTGSNLTFSFWYKSNRTGLHALAFDASSGNAFFSGTTTDYSSTFTVNVADTWEYKTLTTPLSINGNGTNAENLAGAFLTIGFAVPALTTFSSISVGDYFDVTGVQLEVGPVATPFETRPIGMELALCQRYFETIRYQTSSAIAVCQATSTTAASGFGTNFAVTKISTPALIYGTGSANALTATGSNAGGTILASAPSVNNFNWSVTSASGLVAGDAVIINCASTLILQASAEL